MNKDVIYIDVDDDVTAIIGKIKEAKEKIVAIVPPKRAGTLQSAVNLRLLDRMARADKKKMVLITANPALIALAAAAKIPVAKNLQTKPEIAALPEQNTDEGDDIIDGGTLPVGEHAGSIPIKDGTAAKGRTDAIDGVSLDDIDTPKPAKVAKKSGVKIPNFDTFRKKLFFGVAGALGLIALLVWMFLFAPSATVILTARTTPAPLSASVTIGESVQTSFVEGTLRSVEVDEVVDETIEFTATGTGKVGERASGTMTITRTSVSSAPLSVPTGTRFTAGSLSFLSTEPATLAGTTVGVSGFIQDSATIAVQAVEVGAEFNVSARAYSASVGGFSSYGSAMNGGNSRDVRVVSAEDVERAQGELIGRSTDAAKQRLIDTLENGETVIESSFVIGRETAVSSPAVDQEVGDEGKATLTVKTTYSIRAVAQADLEKFLDESLASQLLNDEQRVYDNGLEGVGMSNFRTEGERTTVSVTATGRIGPKIDETQIKEQVKGKRFGEVQATLESISGIQNVDVQFPYFWVRTIPDDTNKITIEFKLEND
jgi:hypothetical protein